MDHGSNVGDQERDEDEVDEVEKEDAEAAAEGRSQEAEDIETSRGKMRMSRAERRLGRE